MEWRQRLRDQLVKAGTNGVKQRDLTLAMEQFVDADTMVTHLEAWLEEEKVQRFKVPTRGRPGIVWRATTKMIEEL